jgi:AraC family transcriptional regulator of adaptative response / DNA-3-methyladenine glycosylase II
VGLDLDPEICERARLARDARFDGRFFVGVRTTGIYCRPICPARPAKAENVRFFPSAAAAAGAGFRPCLRCRPEAAPGTPAWRGTAATVSRALRLIAEGALDEATVEQLAGRLGIGPRHLTRLFIRHLGAPPRAVAQTRRLLFAKKLLDETELPLAEVALSSGFGSVRRFNAVFRQSYRATPGALRAAARRRGASATSGRLTLRLGFRPPFDWAAIVGYLKARAIPGVEAAEAVCYRRTILLDGQAGTLEVRPAAASGQLELAVGFADSRALFVIAERVRHLFDLDADPTEIAGRLRRDRHLAALVEARPGLRLPGAWDGFELAVRAILGQQVTVKGASTLAGRLAAAYGEPLPGGPDRGLGVLFPTPARLAGAELAEIGLPKARAGAIRALARAVRDRQVRFDSARGPDALVRELTRLPGIGDWTAQYVAMRALHEPDAFPADDLGLLRAAEALGLAGSPKELTARAEAWRPWRAYAAVHLWHGAAAQTRPHGERRGQKTEAARDDVLQLHG